MITYRRATLEDNFTSFNICRAALEDFSKRSGVQAITGANDPDTLRKVVGDPQTVLGSSRQHQ